MKKRIPITDILLFSEAWGFIALARLLLLFAPFSKILPYLGSSVRTDIIPLSNKNEFTHIRKAINRASRYSFWRTMCFEQALCAKLMLKCRKKASTIIFGVKKDSLTQEFRAHAWVICNEEIVTGGRQAGEFQIISRFYR